MNKVTQGFSLDEVNRFLEIQHVLQDLFIKKHTDDYQLTAADIILRDELMPFYFDLGRKYALKDNELTRAVIKPALPMI